MTSGGAAQTSGLPQLAKYQVREEIGRGGMATVYRALDTRLGREVALKVIHPHLRDSPEVASRFQTEALAVAKLRHPGIVEVYDVSGPEDSERWLVVELVRGTTLRRMLSEHGVLPPEVAVAIALELLDALSHAHAAGVVHRDVKPENVLVELRPQSGVQYGVQYGTDGAGREGARRVSIKLADFGIAKLLDAHSVTSTGQVLGSPAHMAPEQIEGCEVDARSDVYGLGVLLYETLVGHLPFEGANPAQVLRKVLAGRYSPAHVERPSVGSRWSAIVDRALAHARDERFPSARRMHEAMRAEFDRLGLAPAAELEAWMADPNAYAAEYPSRIVARLCALGDEARRRRDVISAAGDYNRALAQAPGDPRLMRVVAGFHRAEARKRLAFRAAASFVAVLALGIAAGSAVVRGVRGPPGGVAALFPEAPVASGVGAVAPAAPGSIGSPMGGADAPPPSRASPEVAASSVAAAPPPRVRDAPPRARAPVEPIAARIAEARSLQRKLTFDMTPPMGVALTVDDGPSRAVTTGDTLVLDGAEHVLVFSCPVCTSVRRVVNQGTEGETLLVAVPVKPATLIIDGAVGSTYEVVERPEIAVRAGANTIALRSAFERVTVKQMESGASVSVRLEAGQAVQAALPQ